MGGDEGGGRIGWLKLCQIKWPESQGGWKHRGIRYILSIKNVVINKLFYKTLNPFNLTVLELKEDINDFINTWIFINQIFY